MKRSYELTSVAKEDLREIARYTRKQWGLVQARVYIANIEQCAERLALGQGFYKELPALHTGLRIAHCQHHYIVVLPRPNATAVVLAVLHERMDIFARLSSRLPA